MGQGSDFSGVKSRTGETNLGGTAGRTGLAGQIPNGRRENIPPKNVPSNRQIFWRPDRIIPDFGYSLRGVEYAEGLQKDAGQIHERRLRVRLPLLRYYANGWNFIRHHHR